MYVFGKQRRWVAGGVAVLFMLSSVLAACSTAAPAAPTTAPAPTAAPAAPAPTTAPAAAAPTSAPAAAAPTAGTAAATQPALQGPPASGGPFKIGAVVDATGPVPVVQPWIKNGFDLAIEDLTKAGWTGDKQVSYVLEDGKSDPKAAIAGAQKLIQVDHVPYIVSGGSGMILAQEPVVAQAQVVLMNTMATSPKIRETSQGWTFSNIPGTATESKAAAQYAFRELKATKAAILHVNSEFGLGGRDVFKENFEKLGGQIVEVETHAQGQSDYRTQLTKIRAANPDLIYMPSNPAELGNAMKNGKEMGYNVQWMSMTASVTKEALDIAGAGAEGLIATTFPFDPENGTPLMKDYAARYAKKTNSDANVYVALTYDSLILLANAWKSGAQTPTQIRDYLAQMKSYTGPAGTYAFDKDLQVNMPVRFVKRQGDKWQTIVADWKLD